jgi:hypothetical protein
MAVLIQNGYGKGNKIDKAIEANIATGLILSPRHENDTKIRAYIEPLISANPDFKVYFDPQFYATTAVDPALGYLSDYDYFTTGLKPMDLTSPRKLQGIIANALDLQVRLNVTSLMSPTVVMRRLDGSWSQIANILASGSLEYKEDNYPDKPLIISLCISEQFLNSRKDVDSLLDILTRLDVDGFYIVFVRENINENFYNIESDHLKLMMYLIYVLSEINGYEIINGYSDLLGLASTVAGADAITTGWYKKQKLFQCSNFEVSGGGRRPNPRYTSEYLLSQILITPEMNNIKGKEGYDEIVSDTGFDSDFRTKNPSSVAWPDEKSFLHHLSVIQQLDSEFNQLPSHKDRAECFLEKIDRAIDLSKALIRRNALERVTAAHLIKWRKAVVDFKDEI